MDFENSPNTTDPYEEQFEHPEVIEAGDSQVEIVDLNPEEPKTETPLLVVPGWASSANVHKENAKIFAEHGRRTIAMTAPHGVDVKEDEYDNEEEENIPLAELRKAQSVIDVINAKGLEKVDIVTHSEGALFVTAAALDNPGKFRNIVYYAPAGLIGDDNFFSLAKRFGANILQQAREKKEEQEEVIHTALMTAVKAIIDDPKKSLDEVKAIAEMQIQNDLKKLKESGVGIVIMHPADDKVFPMERMQKMVDDNMVDGFVSVGDPQKTGEIPDGHNSWFLDPETFSPAVDSILDSMEAKQQKNLEEQNT